MRDYKIETEKRVSFIRKILEESGAKGIVFGNSGGKDSALVGILCKMACKNTLGVLLPCSSERNYSIDTKDALEFSVKFNIESRTVDLMNVKKAMIESVGSAATLNGSAIMNISPRIRMAALYAIAAAESRLVAGTGNRSEIYVGYYTKWGDGAHDFNPISDLTATEVFEFLDYLNCPRSIIDKAPSAALKEGQTDENEMGVTYEALDQYIITGEGDKEDIVKIERMHKMSEHKRLGVKKYSE